MGESPALTLNEFEARSRLTTLGFTFSQECDPFSPIQNLLSFMLASTVHTLT